MNDSTTQRQETPITANSISEALALLDRAAQRSSEEVKRMLSDDYDSLKRTVAEVTPQIREALRGLTRGSVEVVRTSKDRAVETTRDTARAIDASAHENAWYFIGGAALTALIAGIFIGRSGD